MPSKVMDDALATSSHNASRDDVLITSIFVFLAFTSGHGIALYEIKIGQSEAHAETYEFSIWHTFVSWTVQLNIIGYCSFYIPYSLQTFRW